MSRSRSSSSRGYRRPSHAATDLHDEAAPSVISALRSVQQALRQGRVERAWVDLDNAALCLAREGGLDGRHPALARAAGAVERARDMLGRAQSSQAMAAISGALISLVG